MLTAFLLCAAAFVATPVEPIARWDGMIADAEQKKLAPESGFITNSDSFEKLWKAWRPNEEVPEVDFTKAFILVGVVSGPNRVLMAPTLDRDNLKVLVGGTKRGGPGFGYVLTQISRDGIKSINGRPLDDKGVRVTIVIPEDVESFQGHRLELRVWEYDPLLADVSAKLVDEFQDKDFAHESGKVSEATFTIGGKVEPRKDRRYYITAFVLNGTTRTHMASQEGTSALPTIFGDGDPGAVKLILKPIKQ